MSNVTAKRVILKDKSGKYLLPEIATTGSVEDKNKDPVTSEAVYKKLYTELAKYFPIVGGLFSGNSIGRNIDSSYFTVVGASEDQKGAYLRVFGSEHAEVPGDFQLVANDGSSKVFLTGKANGSLYWNSKSFVFEGDCLAVSGGRMNGPINGNASTFTLSLNGGSGSSDGAYLRLYSKSHNTLPGVVTITAAKSDSDYTQLIMRPDGAISWGGNPFLLVDSSGSYYIRFTNGLQFCWGIANGFTPNTPKQLSFPKEFNAAPVVTSAVEYYVEYSGIQNVTATGFSATLNGASGNNTFWWMAVGKWK